MEGHTVPVLGMGENAPTVHRRKGIGRISTHKNLNAADIARTVTAKLTQGPQSIVPAMITIAKSGKNDLPKTSRVCDKNACDRRLMLRSFPLRFSYAMWLKQGRTV